MKKNKTPEMENRIKKPSWVRRNKWWLILLVALLAGARLLFSGSSGSGKVNFATSNVLRGDLQKEVSATGEIQPVNTVSVGSQVSGTIENLYVDFNSKVKKGDVLLEIEPSVLQASVDEAKASLISAESERNYAKSEYERNKTLYSDGFISRAEMEKSLTTYEQAQQSVARSESQYQRAQTNLGYATITSPVDGTVISREVDVGQTVAASFQTPDLFKIAEDLSKMQIETSVSEADIGVIKDGQSVSFTVDAYPNQTFQGVVNQVRLSPTVSSNVVVYTVVISVDNSDLKLMPGMTAFVTIVVQSAQDTLKVANTGLLLRSFNGIIDAQNGETTSSHLAVLRDGKVVLIEYTKGLKTATETQIISSELKDNDVIIIGALGLASTNEVRMPSPMGGGPNGNKR